MRDERMPRRSRSYRRVSWLVLACAAVLQPTTKVASEVAHSARVLRVCADPNNLPFSNRAGAGFEDALAQLLASDLDARLEYTFWAQRRGFFRNTLNAGACDVVMGVPSSLELVRTTRPYYRGRYVFVTRASRGLRLRTLDDPRLRDLRIGIHVVGDEQSATPPAVALARRGLIANIVGYSLYGDYANESPPTAILDAVRKGEVDAAIVWGPLTAHVAAVPSGEEGLAISAIEPAREGTIPFEFAISIGVRKSDAQLQRELDRLLARRANAIEQLLTERGVPYAKPSAGSPR
jgi:mxaJ protein